MKSPTVSKTKREKMLVQQGSHCACCKVYLPTTRDSRHDRMTNRMLCPECMILVNNIRASIDRGVTYQVVAIYMALSPLKLPVVPGTMTIAEQRAAGRKAVVDGHVPGMTVEQYDQQFKTGPESSPESGLEGGGE